MPDAVPFSSPSLSREFVGPPTLDFEALVTRGTALAQAYAGQQWTDYNEHDPGVTILQQLCFALTDLAYRTEHPIADIALGGAPDIVAAARSQGLHLGDEAFACAPLTEDDYRRLLYDAVVGLQNAWVVPDAQGPEGVYRVLVQRYKMPREGSVAESAADVCARAAAVLHAHRNLGDDFSDVSEVKEVQLYLAGELHVTNEETPEDVVAEVLNAIQCTLVPPPGVVSVGHLMNQGLTPDAVFTGPRLSHGSIDLQPTSWWTRLPAPAQIYAAVQGVRGVAAVHGLALNVAIPPTAGQAARAIHLQAVGSRWAPTTLEEAPLVPTEPWIPVVELGADGPESTLRVLRAGHEHALRPELVASGLVHIRARQRQSEEHSAVATRHLEYLRLPHARNRRLGHYRSLQHFFPAAYGLGPNEGRAERFGGLYGRDALDNRAAVLQLKGYLLFLEQLLCDHLAQLEHVGDLLSSDRANEVGQDTGVEATLFTQPLVHEPADPDEPPLAGQLLRALPETSPTRSARLRDLNRRERALDHLLARFGESFPTDAEARDPEQTSEEYEQHVRGRLTRKRAFLREIIRLGRNRGLGVNYRSRPVDYEAGSTACALAQRLRLLADVGTVHIVEPLLLRRRATPLTAVPMRTAEQLAAAHQELDVAEAQLQSARREVAELRDRAKSAEWGAGLSAILARDDLVAELDDAARKLADARAALTEPTELSPREVEPLKLFVVCSSQDPSATERLARLALLESPAHLDPEVVVVGQADYAVFVRLYEAWLNAWRSNTTETTLISADDAVHARADALHRWILQQRATNHKKAD